MICICTYVEILRKWNFKKKEIFFLKYRILKGIRLSNTSDLLFIPRRSPQQVCWLSFRISLVRDEYNKTYRWCDVHSWHSIYKGHYPFCGDLQMSSKRKIRHLLCWTSRGTFIPSWLFQLRTCRRLWSRSFW